MAIGQLNLDVYDNVELTFSLANEQRCQRCPQQAIGGRHVGISFSASHQARRLGSLVLGHFMP